MSDSIQNDDFISKIKTGVNKGLRVVNIRSREMYDTVKIKNRISSHNKKKRHAFTDLGENVYKMFIQRDQFNEDRIREKCREVARIDQEIKDFEEELEVVHTNARKELGKLKAISKPGGQDNSSEST